ncbi:MAG: S41 family peptidase [Chloroflexi bacterium]|nr:S41 family peptidase [Chloroflexota bacterium]
MQQGTRRIELLKVLLLSILCVVLLAVGFTGGVALDRTGILPGATVSEPSDISANVSILWEAWKLVQERYVDRAAVDPKNMTYGAIEGMLTSLGDMGHTRFLSPDDLRSEQEALAGRLEGIGAQLGMREGLPTIVAPIAGSPAQRAGLRSGDVIVRVDGKDVTDLTLQQIVNMIRGPAGTSVTLSVLQRGDSALTDFTIVRARVTVPNVTWTLLPGAQVAHVLVSQFGERTSDQLAAALKDAQSQGAKGVILDLRNDPGGLRDEAVLVGSQFLRDGNVLLEQDAQGRRTEFKVEKGGAAPDIPLVVLINEGTASAAEIVAGAIQDQRRGLLIGATTFGTGTVLSTFRLSDGSAIMLGIKEWLTPNGRQIWRQGITPDVAVTMPARAVPLIPNEIAGMTPAQLQASQDLQLLRALEEVSPVPVAR